MSTNITHSIVLHRNGQSEQTDTVAFNVYENICDDVLKEIFKKAMEQLPEMALVCKKWKTLIKEEGFYNDFRNSIELKEPKFVYRMADWQADKGIEIDTTAIEPRLPLRAYRDQERAVGIAYLIPKKIEVVIENKNLEVISIDNIENVYKVLKESNTPFKLNMTQLFWNFKTMHNIFEDLGKSFLG